MRWYSRQVGNRSAHDDWFASCASVTVLSCLTGDYIFGYRKRYITLFITTTLLSVYDAVDI